jgi:probable addiction module antidote protein
MSEELTTYDPAEDLLTGDAIAVFMEEALKTEDANYIVHARSVVARAKDLTAKSRPQ